MTSFGSFGSVLSGALDGLELATQPVEQKVRLRGDRAALDASPADLDGKDVRALVMANLGAVDPTPRELEPLPEVDLRVPGCSVTQSTGAYHGNPSRALSGRAAKRGSGFNV